jgi:hypothetical protein
MGRSNSRLPPTDRVATVGSVATDGRDCVVSSDVTADGDGPYRTVTPTGDGEVSAGER